MRKTLGDDQWRDELPEDLSNETVQLFRDMTETDRRKRIGSYPELIQRIDAILAMPLPGRVHRPIAPQPVAPPSVDSQVTVELTQSFIGPRLLALASLAIFAGILVLMLWITGRRNHSAPSSMLAAAPAASFVSAWEIAGPPHPIFNGQSVPLFRQSGYWCTGVSKEGGGILIGRGNSRMTIPMSLRQDPTPNARFRVNLMPQGDALAELVIAAPDMPHHQIVVQIRKGSATAVSTAETPDSNLSSSVSSIAMHLPQSDEVIFYACEVLRWQDFVQVSVNGQALAQMQYSSPEKTSVILRCQAGMVHFADLDLVSLRARDRGAKDRGAIEIVQR
ncbi:MAG: hypothetical protein MI861_08365 [Pirellulales bacterium]|nr:hypothetical protein [Pirellulales bacterium]